MRTTNEVIGDIGMCPACGAALRDDSGRVVCAMACTSYGDGSDGSRLDLRLRRPKAIELPLLLAAPETVLRLVDEIPPGAGARVSGLPRHLPAALASCIPVAPRSGAVALDVGCGNGANRAILEGAGYDYLGADITHPDAPLLADAHAIPVRSSTVDFAISLAVLEHVDHPVVVAREVYRVLKPGALFLGTVAFLEPYHSESKFHHSHLGTQRVLETGGFAVDWIAPVPGWSVVSAQLSNALFPGLPKKVARRTGHAVDRVRAAWLGMQALRGRKIPITTRKAAVAGAFAFSARKGSPEHS